ncbi:MAG: hypothetical protein H8E13_12200 [Actinobacteria bacterium]|nr:hypothetical protein [Actinomycetota bacterium]
MKKLELRKLIKEELLKEDKSMPEEIKNKILDIFALKLKIPEIDDTKFHEVYNKDIDISQMSIITPLFNKLNLRISVAKEFIPKNKK